VAFSSDGKTLLSGSSDGTATLWDAVTGKRLAGLNDPDLRYLAQVVLAPVGKTAVAASGPLPITLWDLRTCNRLRAFGDPKSKDTASRGVFSPDGKTLASETSAGSLHLWEVATGKELWQERSWGGIWPVCPAFSPDGKTLASVGPVYGEGYEDQEFLVIPV